MDVLSDESLKRLSPGWWIQKMGCRKKIM